MSIKLNVDTASAAGTPNQWPQRESSFLGKTPVSPARSSYGSQPPVPPRSDRRLPSNASMQEPLTPQKTPDLSDSEFSGSPLGLFRGSHNSSVRHDRISDMPLPDQFYQLPSSHQDADTSRRKIHSISHDLERLELASKGTTSPIRESREGSLGAAAGLSPHPSTLARSPTGSSREDPFAGAAGALPPPSIPIPSPQVLPSTQATPVSDPFDKIRMLGRPGKDYVPPTPDASQQTQARAAWERVLFTNSAVLCDM